MVGFVGWSIQHVSEFGGRLTRLRVCFSRRSRMNFGWSRALISGVASFGRFGGAMLGPVEGFLTDRFGSGKMVFVGFILGGSGLIFFLPDTRSTAVLLRVFLAVPRFQCGWVRAFDHGGKCLDGQQPGDGDVDRDCGEQPCGSVGASDGFGASTSSVGARRCWSSASSRYC